MGSAPESVLIGSLQKFSLEDGPGIRTTVFMKGCPLHCKWCHNPELIDAEQQLIRSPNNCIGCGHCIEICQHKAISISPDEGIVIDRENCDLCMKCADECYAKALRPVARLMNKEEILAVVKEDKRFYDNTGGGITLSGGEVLMHGAFAKELIKGADESGINVCIDTSGYGDPEELLEMALMDNVTNILYDIKSVDDKVHEDNTGVSNELIINNLKMLAADERTRDKLIMRMPLIKGINDSKIIIEQTGELYKSIGIKNVDLLVYHSLGISKKRNIGGEQMEFEQPTEERIAEIEDYFKNEIKLNVGVLGRV